MSIMDKRLKLAASLAGGLIGLVATARTPAEWKIVPIGFTGGCAVASYVSARRLESAELHSEDNEVSRQLLNQIPGFPIVPVGSPGVSQRTEPELALMGASGASGESGRTSQEMPLEALRSLPQYNWQQILKERDNNAFIGLLAAQGAGKSTLMEWLQVQSPKGVTHITINPHMEPGAFPASNYQLDQEMDEDEFVFGDGSFQFDREMTLEEMMNASPDGVFKVPFYQVLLSSIAEYNHRKKQVRKGLVKKADLKPIDIWIDEANEIYGEFKRIKKQDDPKKIDWGVFVRKALMTFRKYKIRVILAGQASTVGELGLEGLYELKESYTWIRIGHPAKKHAKQCEGLSDSAKRLIETDKMPIMVGSKPAARVPYEILKRDLDAARWNALGKTAPTSSQTPLESPVTTPAPEEDERLARLLNDAIRAKSEGMNKTQIIQEVWRMGGSKWNDAKELWDSFGMDDL